ncbi:galactose-1-phosphate uridylyltransferase [Botrimarina colliarenosi]|uniref:Galactose-1-phosphate uridylyltransferase n=1 Tax=Botrimarina colliarenosi TaxID=2528001 RepID=A0A5C6ACM0_9BACT|nr:DUF4931 domain-containing protein [Botrimarina colliarenosi]TWT96831.1 galactose-1-phosphate uridylyltransferase [Botrimarina colliarenosi]
MSWRYDPLSDRTVRIAPRRAERPSDFGADHAERRCPFCAGAEIDTPPEVDRVADAAGGWLARVVPNHYPAVEGADGVQEVVVESPRHVRRFVELTAAEAAAAVTAWARRLIYWRGEGRFDYSLVFKNEGRAAGASLAHAHSQVIALPQTPAACVNLWRGGIVSEESIAWEDAAWRVVSPPAPRFAYECWLRPTRQAPTLSQLASGDGAQRLAQLLQCVVEAATHSARCDAYNLIVQTPPASLATGREADWWIEVVPRSSGIAGLELATGLWTSPVAPEEAARVLAKSIATPITTDQ